MLYFVLLIATDIALDLVRQKPELAFFIPTREEHLEYLSLMAISQKSSSFRSGFSSFNFFKQLIYSLFSSCSRGGAPWEWLLVAWAAAKHLQVFSRCWLWSLLGPVNSLGVAGVGFVAWAAAQALGVGSCSILGVAWAAE
ncbi:hypothetical protein HYC85_000282 [Camellia sinensis]|uniref:Uncharacterized protein n=1 Tax=Camellia sinensis TaxID=4442 RepID=A0A7J7I1Z9_CAMSI|nr:hypothetical protein HYC85_000282 [Camellia sinensis]